MASLNLAFAGTPEFSVSALDALHAAGHVISLVFTQPDRPAGRGRKPSPSPVKIRALELNLDIAQPESLRTAEITRTLQDVQPDLMVVVAYGLIIPRQVLAIPRLGCINIHASLLPRWRGAAPIQRAILSGDSETGVCIMQMDAGLDTGPVWLREKADITDEDTGGSLHDKLAALGAGALLRALPNILSGQPAPVPQDPEGACYASKLDKAEARIDWMDSAGAIWLRIRAFNPWPVAETLYHGERLRIWSARPEPGVSEAAPGCVVGSDKNGVVVATGDGLLRLLQVQMPGKRLVTAREFANANSLSNVCLGT
ncbi:MAG: methionyl-tRNA formyltransferase [Gammaproteobacteria bacterium]|nr:methionyl-tRNA formyltransferase [Gammaproteobacteria bacterium]